MTKRPIKLEGFAYQQGDTIEVYALVKGKYVRMQGSFKEAKRNWGRATRQMSAGLTPFSQSGLAMSGTRGSTS